ncbi:MAG: hypothetical protein IKF95_00320, partial [Firmicutes bacterium]|nr:hypothetical protein [Bacillota bacterium]
MKTKKSDKRISILLILTLIMAFIVVPVGEFNAGAGSDLSYADDIEDQIDQKENEVDDIKQQQEEVQNELADVAAKIESIQGEIDDINYSISQKEAEVNETLALIEAKKEDIKNKQAEIEKKKKEIQKRIDGLNARLTVMYKNGSVGFVDVLMGSNSISEFVSNVEMIQRIYENDVDLLRQLQEEQKKLEEEKKQLREEEQNLVAYQEQLKVQMGEL